MKMKKILLLSFMAILVFSLASCRDKDAATAGGVCRIHGTISEKYNDKQIFLVPLTNDSRWNVDSVYIKDGKFEFESDTLMMAKILVDYHFRFGLQPLLVVVEPGDVTVVIDSISSATGTVQNDSLNKWKKLTELHNMESGFLRRSGRQAEADSVHLAYKQMTRRMADNLKEGSLHKFLKGLYPLTFKKRMPDGRIATINADTNEEISE